MNQPIRRLREPCLSRVAGMAVLVAALGGCAGASAAGRDDSLPRADRAVAKSLYDGQPATVHATQYPVTSAAEGIARGDDAWRKGELDLAVYMYVQSLAYDSTSAVPFLKIGAIHEKRGNSALAAKAFQLALAREPDNAGANERLGLLYLQDGRADAATPLLERAITLDPRRWQSHNGLGIAADGRKDFAAAIAHYDAALAIEPMATMVINNRGYSRYLAGDFATAETEFQLAISLGARAGASVNLGMAQARQRKYAQALESFMKEHDEAHARNLLGEAAMEGGDLETAQNEFMLALSASPRFFQDAQDNLEQVAKLIAERQNPASPPARTPPQAGEDAPVTSASAQPISAETAAALASWNADRYYGQSGKSGKQRQKQAGNGPQTNSLAAPSCAGAAAMKPPCNPYATKKRTNPRRIASYKPPKF